MLSASDLKPFETLYTFVANDGTNTHIAAERLRQWCLAAPNLEIFEVPVEKRIAEGFIKRNIVSYANCVRLVTHQHLNPLIYAKTGTFTEGRPDVMLVDGHHRYVYAAAAGRRTFPAFILEEAEWHPFRVAGALNLTQEELEAVPVLPRTY